MGFDNALETILVHFRGPLVDELSRYLTETRTLGAQRTLALREVPNRLGDPPDLVEFVDAVNRAQVMGTGLLAAVDSQMVLLRQERRRRVASAAARAPVRMLIPMTLFMLPVLMLTVLAPVGLRLANSLGGLH
jgi:tight adherence protein C